ncbi:MAG: beta-ketoacyl-ACP synthase III [Actinomycetota bacterium]
MRGSTITGIGVQVPTGELPNSELAARLSVSEEWIFGRTGISSRHVVGDSESSSSLGIAASQRALEHAGLVPSDLDTIIVATISPDMQFPATASLVQHALGATNAAAFDLGAGCSGFLFGLAQAKALVESGSARRVLVVGADILSRFADRNDARSIILFGDGAGATVVEGIDAPTEIGHFVLRSDGANPELLCLTHERPYIQMNGREVYRAAVAGMTSAVLDALDAEGSSPEGTWLVAHQANARILEAVARRLEWPEGKVIVNIDQYGNTSSASIPLALDEAMRDGRLQDGDDVMLTAFGAGFAWGAGLIRWRIPSPVTRKEAEREALHV